MYFCNGDTDKELEQQIDKIVIVEQNKLHLYPKQKKECLKEILSNLVFYKVEEDSYVKDDLKYKMYEDYIEVSTVGIYELLKELSNVKCITNEDLKNFETQFNNNRTFKK